MNVPLKKSNFVILSRVDYIGTVIVLLDRFQAPVFLII